MVIDHDYVERDHSSRPGVTTVPSNETIALFHASLVCHCYWTLFFNLFYTSVLSVTVLTLQFDYLYRHYINFLFIAVTVSFHSSSVVKLRLANFYTNKRI